MDERERRDIIHVLERAVNALKRGDIKELKDLSNQTIHNAAIFQEEYSVTVAVLIYSLSKIHEREMHYSKFKGWKRFQDTCYSGLVLAKERLVNSDLKGFDEALKVYVGALSKLDPKLKSYIYEVFDKARINKASRLYEHGLSIGRTAELLGITKFELMDYIGKTNIADVRGRITVNARSRLEFARRLFS